VRCHDPFARREGCWLLRRLAPHCARIELALLPKRKDEERLLHAMGWETANIHLGAKAAADDVKRDLAHRPAKWLQQAAEKMADCVTSDWRDWNKG